MTEPLSDARSEILDRLRSTLAARSSIFRAGGRRDDLPAVPTAVTDAEGDPVTLARLFAGKLEAVQGSAEIVAAAEAAPCVVDCFARWRDRPGGASPGGGRILSWDPEQLPVPGLASLLEAAGFTLIVPHDLHDPEGRNDAAVPDLGLTGVDAAFASTGSVVAAAGAGKNRAASLLPLHHVLLIPLSRLFPTFEAWLHRERGAGRLEELVRQAGQVVFITGPSKSADIELQLTLGVHGPGAVHAVLFDDAGG